MNGIYPGLTFGKATRDAYGEALRDLGAKHSDIVVLDADLAKSTKSFTFGEVYPDRFWNVGMHLDRRGRCVAAVRGGHRACVRTAGFRGVRALR